MSTYIKLSDVQKILLKYKPNREHLDKYFYSELMEGVISLPSIDFEEMIEKEIYGLYTVNVDGEPQNEYYSDGQIALRKLLNKLPK